MASFQLCLTSPRRYNGTVETPGDAALRELRGLRIKRVKAETAIIELVETARLLRVTWREIGEALGISAQTAHRKFTPEAKAAEVERQRKRAAAR